MAKPSLPITVLSLLHNLNVEVEQVIVNGPRYATLVVRYGGEPAIFKMALADRAAGPFQAPQRLTRVMAKEVLLLEFLDRHQNDTALLIPSIYQWSVDELPWYLRQILEGQPMAKPGHNFMFRDDFFELVDPRLIVQAFGDLHRLSFEISDELAERLEHTRHDLNVYEGFANWRDVTAKLPSLNKHTEAIQQFFDKARPVYDLYMRDRRYSVIGHNEPYPSHIFLINGKLGLIDWENAGWTNRLRDFSNIWIRALADPKWQERFTAAMDAAGYLDANGKLIWQTELLMQSIANLGFFSRGGEGDAAYQAKATAFFEATINDILASHK